MQMKIKCCRENVFSLMTKDMERIIRIRFSVQKIFVWFQIMDGLPTANRISYKIHFNPYFHSIKNKMQRVTNNNINRQMTQQ